jgi:hypothetical protein
VVWNREVVSGVLIVAETPVPAQRQGFDHDGVFGVGEVGTHRARSVSRIAEDLETRRFVFEERHTDGSVPDVRWGQVTGGDDPGFGFDRDVGLVSVPIRRSGLCMCRVSGSIVEMTRSFTVPSKMRQVPSSSPGSTS